VVSSASISTRRFGANRAGTLRLTLNEAARVFLAITQQQHGHLVRHRCTTKAYRGKSCQVRLTFRRLVFRAAAGRNAFKLQPWHLAPGRYTALINATDRTGHRSRTIGIRLTIARVAIQHSGFRSVGGSLEAVAPILMR
jgi:hypothetical protein